MKWKVLAAAAPMTACAFCHAASSVEMYGLIEAGITTYSNAAAADGSSAGRTSQVDTGFAQGSRIGLRGTEDLGNGMQAIFTLENGFNADTGTMGQGGLLFGRSAWVGLKTPAATVTVGRQYDFMGDMAGYSSGALMPGGLLSWNLHSHAAGGYLLDDRVWGEWTNNAIKVTGNPATGMTVGLMYGMGEQPGATSKSATASAIVGYDRGDTSMALAATRLNDVAPGRDKTVYGAGVRQGLAPFTVFGMVTHAALSGTDAPKVTTFEAGVTYDVSQPLQLGAAVLHQRRNNGVGSADTLLLSTDYRFSRRTDAYVEAAVNRDRGYRAVVVAALGPTSDGHSQSALRLGIRHKF